MCQLEESKAEAAEERSEQTRSFVRTVKAAARRKYTPEEKIRIVLEGFRREVTVNDLCRREGIKPHSYYSWTKEFMESGKERLTRDSVRDATQHEVGQLKRENGELKEPQRSAQGRGTSTQLGVVWDRRYPRYLADPQPSELSRSCRIK